MIKVGCCGFSISRERYVRYLEVVEVQQIFYDPPRLLTIEKWRKEVPEGFEFTIKAWQLITHSPTSPTYRRLKRRIDEGKKGRYGNFQNTDEVFEAWETVRKIAEVLLSRIVVFQTPSSFIPSDESIRNLKGFFRKIERKGIICVWEPRGCWENEQVYRICRELDLVPCMDPFRTMPRDFSIFYLRLHGRDGYRYKYTDSDLRKLIEMTEDFKEGYFMFNNISMFEDALRMKEMFSIYHDKAK